jgi:hypothetical protein
MSLAERGAGLIRGRRTRLMPATPATKKGDGSKEFASQATVAEVWGISCHSLANSAGPVLGLRAVRGVTGPADRVLLSLRSYAMNISD